jgi:nickel-type superoxide dismutase maturation protease
MMNEIPAAGLREYALWLLRRLHRYRVTGDSMQPTLKPDTEILANPRAYRDTSPRQGDIVVAKHPYRTDIVIVKRVASVAEGGACRLRSDNPDAGTDSGAFGDVKPERILGRVTHRFD